MTLPSQLAASALALAALAATPPAVAQATSSGLVLEALDGTESVRAADAEPLRDPRTAGAAIVRYPSVDSAAADADPEARAVFAMGGGDRLEGTVAGGDGDLLRVDLGGIELPLRIDGLRSVIFPGRLPRDGGAAPGDGIDVLYFTVDGGGLDRAEGLVDSFDGPQLIFEDDRAGVREIPWSRVAALFVSPLDEGLSDGAEGERDERVPVVVGLRHGGRLFGRLVELDAKRVRLQRTDDPEPLELPAALVDEVSIADGSLRFLSDVDVSDAGPQSLFGDDLGFTWPHRIDRAVDGRSMSVAGRAYVRGIGVHAPSRLTWKLDGGWNSLRLSAGVDDSAAGLGRGGVVRFRVFGDGRKLWDSDLVRVGQNAVPSGNLDLAGVEELVLEVDPVDDFVLDRANWLRPVLVKAEIAGAPSGG